MNMTESEIILTATERMKETQSKTDKRFYRSVIDFVENCGTKLMPVKKGYWYRCPVCSSIVHDDFSNFCFKCGIELDWEKVKEHEERYEL